MHIQSTIAHKRPTLPVTVQGGLHSASSTKSHTGLHTAKQRGCMRRLCQYLSSRHGGWRWTFDLWPYVLAGCRRTKPHLDTVFGCRPAGHEVPQWAKAWSLGDTVGPPPGLVSGLSAVPPAPSRRGAAEWSRAAPVAIWPAGAFGPDRLSSPARRSP